MPMFCFKSLTKSSLHWHSFMNSAQINEINGCQVAPSPSPPQRLSAHWGKCIYLQSVAHCGFVGLKYQIYI